jgi:hypothetical protein
VIIIRSKFLSLSKAGIDNPGFGKGSCMAYPFRGMRTLFPYDPIGMAAKK